MVNATPPLFYSRERDPVPIVQDDESASEPIWKSAKNLACTGVRAPNRPSRSESLHPQRYRGPDTIDM